MTPTLSTRRLNLRPLTKATQRQVDWLRDPKVVRYSEQRHQAHTLSSCARYVSKFIGRSHIWGLWTVDKDEHIGNLSALTDDKNDVCDMGMLIGVHELWHRGFGSEAWKTAADWLLSKDGGAIRKLEAGCMKPNEGMLRVLRAGNFTFESERPAHFLLDGNPVGVVYYGRYR